ncbi:MAG TPA: protein-glutamate O-methyltransferase CheR [Syntrophothermus lipocalidus]|uniref:protein-glutamate O-methyltransferase n=1 Tax=Syntrophothermus lipocalidus (strain DSM 12680 / TGB-C1) TaxID=643648 RepID=D7CP48_SYNLT|nr:protein-glutamate O-methyltransferase CheR [Syntrophothermus lipocalidus]ADI02483.1 MCP methyltransferase, CheR-type [Syntrophothermus lipocalidus DSM 12680]HHV77288.1 protein-glutamate O-methyltransferase CheR [Syntrophothermus lipocalidus]
MDLPIEDFIALRNLIYERTGMFFGENKIYYIKKRLHKRMQACCADTVHEYIRFLKFFDPKQREFQELVNLLTVNETYFFREFSQLKVFAEHCLPEIVEQKQRTGDTTLKLFSAGCSTGEEPYTLAIILSEMLDDPTQWEVMIKAVDIDENVLKTARRGVYDPRSVKDVPPAYLQKYFTTPSPGVFAVKPELQEIVVFEHLNLMDRRALRYENNYDFIFCRNVLIYFDDAARKQLVERFYTMLNKGGFIFLGHAESLSRISTAFKIRKMDGHIVYQA